MSRKSVEVSQLTRTYVGRKGRRTVAVNGIDLTVAEGELLVLLGPSGCGKTTTLRSVAGLLKPTAGRITIDGTTVFDREAGVNVPTHKRDIGMVFQNFALWPHMTVRSNVAYPLRSRRRETGKRRAAKVMEALEMVQCAQFADRYPGALSGGQQQRIALARALAAEPALLLLDEPLSSLDALLRRDLRQQLRELHRRLGFTGIYVTHDQAEALTLGTRVAVMSQGEVAELGRPEDVFREPGSAQVAEFLGFSRVGTAARAEGGGWRLNNGDVFDHLAGVALPDAGEAALYARPRDLSVGTGSQNGNDRSVAAQGAQPRRLCRVEILEVLPASSGREILVRTHDDLTILAGGPSPAGLHAGDKADLYVHSDCLRAYAAS